MKIGVLLKISPKQYWNLIKKLHSFFQDKLQGQGSNNISSCKQETGWKERKKKDYWNVLKAWCHDKEFKGRHPGFKSEDPCFCGLFERTRGRKWVLAEDENTVTHNLAPPLQRARHDNSDSNLSTITNTHNLPINWTNIFLLPNMMVLPHCW